MTYSYVPGSCNLGKAEVRRRQFVALIGALLTLFGFAGLLAADLPNSARWSLFAPLMIFSVTKEVLFGIWPDGNFQSWKTR